MNHNTPLSGPARERCGCPDFSLSRRRFLGGVAAGTGTMVAGSLFGEAFRQVTYGAAPDGNVLVVLSFRGGADGLSIVVPTGPDHDLLVNLRPDIYVPKAALLGNSTAWGLNPGLTDLVPMWNAGTFGAVHGTGLPEPNRSHFEAMELVELAHPGSNERQGWINRTVGLNAAADPEEEIGFGSSMLPTSLVGPAPALGAYGVNDLSLPTLWNDKSPVNALTQMWGGTAKTPLTTGVTTALGAVSRLQAVAETDMDPIVAAYPEGPLQSVLANTATLIKANLGAKFITIDYGDWDMHTGLGQPETGGWMFDHLKHLGESLAHFFSDLGTVANRVTVVTLTEFGRRIEQNGSGAEAGLDHGYGNAMLVLGAGVNGGDVRGNWIGLDQDNDGDVSLANDYRHVLWEVLVSRFPEVSADKATIFPGMGDPPAIGIMA